MGEHRDQFQARLKQINRKHTALSSGCAIRMQPDGLLVAKPLRTPSRGLGRKGLYVLAAFLVCKASLICALGEQSYDARVARLSQGNGIEQFGAMVMQRDPASMALAGGIRQLLG